MKRIGTPSERRLSPAAEVVERLRSFEDRTGRKLTPNQRWVLQCCERQIGASVSAQQDQPANEARIEELKEALAKRVAEYTGGAHV